MKIDAQDITPVVAPVSYSLLDLLQHLMVDPNNLALLYRAQKQYCTVLSLAQRGFAICERALIPSHWQLGRSLNTRAELYYAQGQYMQVYGLHHPEVAICLNNLAKLYNQQGR